MDEGINTQDVYPFQGAQKRCHYKSGKSGATVRSFQRVKHGSEIDLTSAVAMVGPIAAGIDASHNTFRVSTLSNKILYITTKVFLPWCEVTEYECKSVVLLLGHMLNMCSANVLVHSMPANNVGDKTTKLIL